MKQVLLQQLFWWVSSSRDLCSPEYLLDFRHNTSRFGHFLEQKMNCIPHFWAKNANKMVLIPHLVKMAWAK